MAERGGAKKNSIAMAKPPEVFYRINSLLYTLRAIAQREDQLCMLMHHLRTSGRLNAELTAELHEILEEIPTQEYLEDLGALQASLNTLEGRAAQTGTTRVVRGRNSVKRRAA